MKSDTRSFLCLVAALLFAAGLALGQETAITILHVNDTHAHLDGFGPKNHHLEGELGGIARAATVIGTERATAENVVLLHAGDVFTGDLFFNKYLAVPEWQIMTALGFDAEAVGNHEFDLGPDPLAYALSLGLPNVEFPLLSANLDMSAAPSLTNWIRPSIVKTFGSVKVGIFGMTVFDDPTNMPSPVVIEPDIVGAATKAVADLKAQNVQVVVCLSHLGVAYDRQIAAAVSGIDFIVGGHNHYLLSAPEEVTNPDGKKTFIVQAGEFYEQIGKLRISVNASGEVALKDWSTIPVNKHVPADPTIQGIVDGLKKGIVEQYGRVYDKIDAITHCDLDKVYRADSPLRDTPLGNLVTDAFRKTTHTQIALTVAGMISEKIYAGPIVGADVFRSMSYGYDPNGSGYGYNLMTMKIQGTELLKGLETTLAMIGVNEDFFPAVSGMTFKYDVTKDPGSRILLASIRIGNRHFDPSAFYSLTTNIAIYYILGGLGVKVKDEQPTADFEYPVVREFIKKLHRLSYRAEGRIRDVSIRCHQGEGPADDEGAVVEDEGDDELAPAVKEFSLNDNYPNPFNPSTTISYALPGRSHVTLKIFNSLGQEVTTLVDGIVTAGVHDVRWDATTMASGVYFCRVTAAGENGAGSFSATKKLMLVK